MIILRYKNYSNSDKKDNNSNRDIAVGGLTTAGVAGGSLLYKSMKDKKAKTEHKSTNEKLSKSFKENRKELAKERRNNINKINRDTEKELNRVDSFVETAKQRGRESVDLKKHPTLAKSSGSEEARFKKSAEASNSKQGASAGYDKRVKVDTEFNRINGLKQKVTGQEEAKEAIRGSRKGFVNVEKTRAAGELEKLKKGYEDNLRKNSRNLRNSLNKNKKVARVGLIAAPVAGAAAYGVSKAVRRKKKDKEENK